MPFSVMTPTLTEQEQFLWRAFLRKDIPEIHDLFERANEGDDNDYAETIQDLERQYDDPWSDPRTDARTIRNLAGKLVGFLRVYVNPKPQHENVAFLDKEIAPEARGQGLEEQALHWMEERAQERLAGAGKTESASKLPRLIRAGFQESASDQIELYKRRGYRHVRSFYKMERDLDQPIDANPLPEGLVFRSYSEELDEKMLAAFNEAFGDHWGHQDVTEDEWHQFIMDASDVRRDLTLVVMDGDEVAAFSINRVKKAENARLGIQRGWIGTLGTRRAWRKRGLASALLSESMRRFKAEGLDWAGLGVDAENWTGALQLYERNGFKPFKTRIVLEKRIG